MQLKPRQSTDAIWRSVLVRFFKYAAIGGMSQCWMWKGAVDKDGYGRLQSENKTLKAHRVSFEISKGKIPEGKIVCHKCDIPGCVNPLHLYAGTHKSNVRDCMTRGRHKAVGKPHFGADNPKAKLTAGKVRQLRTDRAAGVKVRALCIKYGVCKSTVERVVSGKYWGQA